MSKILLEHEAKELLVEHDIPVLDFAFCEDYESLEKAANDFGYPVVIKVVSPQIVHKSDAGGVVLNIKNDQELKESYDTMMKSALEYEPNADIKGVIISPHISGGLEVIVGSTVDPQFGPVIMVGLGGIFVEIFKDTAFGVAPVDEQEALEMLESLQAYPLLKGTRGKKGTDLKLLSQLIVKVSEFIMEQNVKELDLNPIFCFEDRILAVDARMIIEE